MKLLKASLLALLIVVLGGNKTMAQSKTFTNIRSVEKRNQNVLIKDGDIIGYYSFFMMDKVDKKTNEYQLVITDQNLNVLSTKKILESKTSILQEAVYDGSDLLFRFYDFKAKQLYIKKLSESQKYTEVYRNDVKGRNELASIYTGATTDIRNMYVFPLEGGGFVEYTTKKFDKVGYIVNIFAPSTSKLIAYKSNSKAGLESATYLASNSELVVSVVSKVPKLLSTDIKYFILGLDRKTAKKKYEVALKDSKYELSVVQGYTNPKNEIVIIGQYYEQGANVMKDKSLGMFTYKIDNDGNFTSKRYVSWTKDVSKYLNVNEKGKVEDAGYLYIHNVIETAEGKIFAIGESFRKSVSALGVASKVLNAQSGNSSASAFKIVVEDFYLFQFNDDFELEDVKIFEKTKNDVLLPNGAGLYGAQILSKLVKAYDGFAYDYIQKIDTDTEGFMVGYRNFERLKKEKNEWRFGAIIRADGQYTTDYVSLSSKDSDLRVFPAKSGHIMIAEYFKKEKKLELRIEKLNF